MNASLSSPSPESASPRSHMDLPKYRVQKSAVMPHPPRPINPLLSFTPKKRLPQNESHPVLLSPPPSDMSAMENSRFSLFFICFFLVILGLSFFLIGFFSGRWSAPQTLTQQDSSAETVSVMKKSGFSNTQILGFLSQMHGRTGRLAHAAHSSFNAGEGEPHSGHLSLAGPSGSSQAHAQNNPSMPSPISGHASSTASTSATPSSAQDSSPIPSYTLLLGTFFSKENAILLMKKLRDMQIVPVLVEDKKTENLSYRVYSGSYSTHHEAQMAANILSKRDQHLTAIPSPIPPSAKDSLKP